MDALRLPAFFENSPHSNVILTVGGGVFGQKDGLTPGAVACRQAVDAWKDWKSGQYGNISLNDGVIDFARTHEEINGAFLDLDTLLPLGPNLFWVDTPGCAKVAVRDICYMELASFRSLAWGLFYAVAVIVCSTHLCLVRQKAVTALATAIPKQHRGGAIHMGYASAIFIAMAYASFPVYTHLFAMSSGSLSTEPAQL